MPAPLLFDKPRGRRVIRIAAIGLLVTAVVWLAFQTLQTPAAPGAPDASRAAVDAVADSASQPSAAADTAAPAGRDRTDFAAAPPSAASSASPTEMMSTARLQARAIQELVDQIKADRSRGDALARLLMQEPDSQERHTWVTALAVATPDLLARTLQAMATSNRADVRSAVSGLIELAPLDGATLSQLSRQLLASSTDSAAKLAGLTAQRMARQFGDRSEASADNVRTAYELAGDPDPDIRSQAIANLVSIDRTDAVEPVLRSALRDTQQVVQLTAIEGVVESGARSPELKSELLRLSADTNAEFEVRLGAINALDGFRLTKEERRHLDDLVQRLN
jgi:hypothetical protein